MVITIPGLAFAALELPMTVEISLNTVVIALRGGLEQTEVSSSVWAPSSDNDGTGTD